MANQPTKYRKFVVGAASAALVASAVAPVASAKDFSDTKGNTHEPAIDALSDAGIITGYQDGTFKPNKTLTRSDVVKLMGKWLVSEGYEVPSDYKTNPRFTDLTSASNDELLKYAAVVKDNGVFNGSNGRLLAGDNITRENMAVVLVRAFDTVNDFNLVEYVQGQDFKQEVTDRNAAKAEARTAIDVLDFFDITTVATFNPKDTTTRGHFASFLHRALNTDFSKVTGVVTGVESIKAVNATTVEVKFVEGVKDINSLKFAIEGLTVSNAVVKQSDAKTVILTTSAQEGGKKYDVTLNGDKLGSFEGISALIPTSIKMNTTSVQSKVGNEVILKADIGVKEANVPVTFNVTPNAALNKAQVEEVYTDANGIATFSYTQYTNGEDFVTAYPTGAPTKRDFATVYWGVDTILTIEEDKAGASVANGTKKVYTVTYLDPQTGRPVVNQDLNVSFLENIDVDYSAVAKATVTNPKTGVTKTPYQAKSGAKEELVITTDSTGKATFVVSGTNVAVTPFVFVDKKTSTVNNNRGNGIFDKEELMQAASKVTFAGAQVNYALTVTPVGDAEAAAGSDNGRVYKVAVTNPNDSNKPYAGGVINVSLDELMERNMSTNSKAQFENVGNSKAVTRTVSKYGGDFGQQATIKLDAKGEASFLLYGNNNDQGTPVVWIDQNNSLNTQSGVLEDGEPSTKAATTYFQLSRVIGADLYALNNAGKAVKDFPRGDSATFTFDLTNQSDSAFGNYTGKVTFEIRNTGANALTLQETDDVLYDQNGQRIANPTTIEVGGAITVTTNVVNGKANLKLYSTDATSATIYASAVTGTNWSGDVRNDNKYVAAEVFTATFSGEYVPANFTGTVVGVDKTKQEVTLRYGSTNYTLSYKGAEYYYNTSSVQSTLAFFESRLSNGDLVTFTKGDGDKIKNKFDIIKDETQVVPVTDLAFTDTNPVAGTVAGEIKFTATEGQIYTVELGDTVIAKDASGKYTVANTPYVEDMVITVTADSGDYSETTTLKVVDNKSASEAEAAAFTAVTNAIKTNTWAGVTPDTFTAAGITGVTLGNIAKVKSDLVGAYESLGRDLTKAEIQEIITPGENSNPGTPEESVVTVQDLNADLQELAPGIFNVVVTEANATSKLQATNESVLVLEVPNKETIELTYDAEKGNFVEFAVQGYTKAELLAAKVTLKK
ncbi:S-layer homology domain-containing protein [Sporosarcina sp. SAFN-015]|uniref:S-layer homology domain-containing protein n=1 Tax=Sporosarcina sp. SAFN-015 TaxID=3387274 RepID=UPI003F7FB403